MRRRFRADGKQAKTRRPKAVAPKRKNPPKVARGSIASGDSGEAQIARELRDAQDQLTTTAEILEVIRACDCGTSNSHRASCAYLGK
jgi:hypothetical protein